jgi:hypothetical protein
MIDFSTIDYLESGNERQKKVFGVLKRHSVMELLSDFDPILVGTLPINIDIETSDLDIICFWKDKHDFRVQIEQHFNRCENFSIRESSDFEHETIIADCTIDGFEIEIFGQPIPSRLQNGYRHMVIENEILQFKGEDFRKQIMALKKQGIKTEPAFAQLLNLKGDPHQALLQFRPDA